MKRNLGRPRTLHSARVVPLNLDDATIRIIEQRAKTINGSRSAAARDLILMGEPSEGARVLAELRAALKDSEDAITKLTANLEALRSAHGKARLAMDPTMEGLSRKDAQTVRVVLARGREFGPLVQKAANGDARSAQKLPPIVREAQRIVGGWPKLASMIQRQ